MKKIAALLPIVLLGSATLASAFDDDPGTLSDRRWSGGRPEKKSNPNAPLYYRPTQRYYGPGYTINYRFVPVFASDGSYSVAANGASNFRVEAFHMATEDVPGWGAYSPKITVKDPRSGGPRTAVTSIVRKKTTTRSTTTNPAEAPAITPNATDAPAPVPAVAPKP